MTKKQAIKNNLSLFGEAFLSSVLISKQDNDSETLQFLKDSIERKLDTKGLSAVESLEELYEFIINFWSGQFQFKFRDLLLGLMINQKGLTYEELKSLCSLEESSWKHFKSIFRFCLIEYKEMYMIQEPIFRSSVIRIFSVKEEGLRQLHERIADVLEATPNSIRKL